MPKIPCSSVKKISKAQCDTLTKKSKINQDEKSPLIPRAQYAWNSSRKECKFCRNNGEAKDQYSGHVLRNPQTGQLICPVLRSHICEVCGATGDKAHIWNYCPKVKEEKKNKHKYANPVLLQKTMRQ